MKKGNREQKAGIRNERVRKALYEVHVKAERKLRKEMGLSDEQSST
jgi:hypothetical protein